MGKILAMIALAIGATCTLSGCAPNPLIGSWRRVVAADYDGSMSTTDYFIEENMDMSRHTLRVFPRDSWNTAFAGCTVADSARWTWRQTHSDVLTLTARGVPSSLITGCVDSARNHPERPDALGPDTISYIFRVDGNTLVLSMQEFVRQVR